SEAEKERMTRFSLAGGRPVNWHLLAPNARMPGMHVAQLAASDYAAERGGRVVALTLPQPMKLRINLVSGFIFDAFPGWARIIGMPLPERALALADSAVRAELAAGASSPEAGVFAAMMQWESWSIDEVFTGANAEWRGRTIAELAAARGSSPLDALLDIALSEDLRTSFAPPVFGEDEESWRLRGEAWRDPRTMIGASDAGAHLDMLDTFAFSTQVLARGVRERSLIGLEEAVRQLSAVPAELIGLRDRGVLRAGLKADVVIFDPATIDCGPTHTRFDLPGGAGRLYAEAIGVHHVIVNGREIVREGSLTGERPGTVLRSGRDTVTVLP
ncbi:MAG: amidohydrolase family protein, partial [Gammaproteobacteria bacterium]